jgi:predicted RND superfamily exporter protein
MVIFLKKTLWRKKMEKIEKKLEEIKKEIKEELALIESDDYMQYINENYNCMENEEKETIDYILDEDARIINSWLDSNTPIITITNPGVFVDLLSIRRKIEKEIKSKEINIYLDGTILVDGEPLPDGEEKQEILDFAL